MNEVEESIMKITVYFASLTNDMLVAKADITNVYDHITEHFSEDSMEFKISMYRLIQMTQALTNDMFRALFNICQIIDSLDIDQNSQYFKLFSEDVDLAVQYINSIISIFEE